MRFYPAPFTPEQTRAWVERQLERYRDDGFGLWMMEDRSTSGFLGTAGPSIQVVEGAREVEIGWHVRPGAKGLGIAPEAGRAARDWAFAHLDVDHLISLVRPENTPSARVAEKLGMRVEREADYHGLRHHVWRIDRPTAGGGTP
jgi:RimJ/RimL family protein N-acetyltransferase